MVELESSTGASRGQILRATLWAALAAALIVITIILPAEFGIDVTGVGRLTGLSRMASTTATSATETLAAEPSDASANVVNGAAAPLTSWAVPHSDRFVAQRYEITMQGDEEFEYKANMNRGDALLYTWRVREGSEVYFEFHGEPTSGEWPKDYYESYQKGEASSANGSMVAPFTGHHGWYWLNLHDQPVTLIVELTGYYSQFAKIEAPAEPAGQ